MLARKEKGFTCSTGVLGPPRLATWSSQALPESKNSFQVCLQWINEHQWTVIFEVPLNVWPATTKAILSVLTGVAWTSGNTTTTVWLATLRSCCWMSQRYIPLFARQNVSKPGGSERQLRNRRSLHFKLWCRWQTRWRQQQRTIQKRLRREHFDAQIPYTAKSRAHWSILKWLLPLYLCWCMLFGRGQ